MDADVLTTISSLAMAAKATIEAVRVALAKNKTSQETLTLVTDLHSRVLQLQEIAFRLYEEKVQAVKEKNEALEENVRLRAEISRDEEWAVERKRYQRKNRGGSVVMVREDEPEVLLCPFCLEKDHVAILLQPSLKNSVNLECPNCRFVFPR